MFDDFKKIDESIYRVIVNEVIRNKENKNTNACIEGVRTVLSLLLKEFNKSLGYVAYQNGKEETGWLFHALKEHLLKHLMTPEQFDQWSEFLIHRNKLKYEQENYQVVPMSYVETMCKLLYRLCYQYYVYKTGEHPEAAGQQTLCEQLHQILANAKHFNFANRQE